MAIVRALGKPSLFITMTCNPAWEEVTRALLPGQRPEDRPDVVARVFNLKLQRLLDDIKQGAFGGKVGHLSVIEFQKRGKLTFITTQYVYYLNIVYSMFLNERSKMVFCIGISCICQ